jgi:hypothetical protein
MIKIIAASVLALFALTATAQAAQICCQALALCCDGGPCCDD